MLKARLKLSMTGSVQCDLYSCTISELLEIFNDEVNITSVKHQMYSNVKYSYYL